MNSAPITDVAAKKTLIRIVLAEDNRMVREGLRIMLERQEDMNVVGEASDGAELIRIVHDQSPDLAITEVGLPHLNGIEATRQILASGDATAIVALTVQTQRRLVAQMLRAGASAYVLKDCGFEELLQAIHAVAKGKAYLCADVTPLIIEHYIRNAPDKEPSAFDALTTREREVLQLVTEGQSTKNIATRLNLTTKTIEFHRHRIMTKLDLHTIAELTKYALRSGITTLQTSS